MLCEEGALDEFGSPVVLIRAPVVAKTSRHVQTGICTQAEIYLCDSSNRKILYLVLELVCKRCTVKLPEDMEGSKTVLDMFKAEPQKPIPFSYQHAHRDKKNMCSPASAYCILFW